MRKTVAIFLVPVGLVLAVAVPVFVIVLYNMDPIRNSAAMVGLMMPGLAVVALARNLWRSGEAPNPTQEPIPPGYRVCDRCRKLVAAPEGAERARFAPREQKAFVCDSCNSYRTKRALVVLLLFFTAIGGCILVGSLLIPDPKKKK
jgi:hypothetical protein